MFSWLMPTAMSVAGVLLATAAFFFITTRGALIVRGWRPKPMAPADHVYPIYSEPTLMRLVDFQPIIAGILLFQYSRLVDIITRGMARKDLRGRRVMITSCAFGNVMPRIAKAAHDGQAAELQVVDIIENELAHARRKLEGLPAPQRTSWLRGDAATLRLPDGSVDVNVIFFLLHELPHEQKGEVLREACRVLAPGGTLYLAEFHRPSSAVLRLLSQAYFAVFEPLGRALWDTHDPVAAINALPGMHCERHTVCLGNYQVVVATRQG